MNRPAHRINYADDLWIEVPTREVNTLQVFITNRCNMRCPECFNLKNLGPDDMPFEQYQSVISEYGPYVEKVILVGGEPTLHPKIREIIRFNHAQGKRTTIYTNGARLNALTDIPLQGLSVRVSVFGIDNGWKALRKLKPYSHLHVMFTYMLKHDNIDQLLPTAQILEEEYGCKDFLISTCRGEDYWTEYDYTLPLADYGRVIDAFLKEYQGNMTLHIATRGVLVGKSPTLHSTKCRYANVFLDKLIQCPFDIERNHTTNRLSFSQVDCTKHDFCILTKIKLQRRTVARN